MKCVHGVRVDRDCRYCATGTEPALPSAASAGSLADAIVDDLFYTYDGKTASRLVLEVDGREAGGYCKEAIKAVILKHLQN